MSYLNINDLIYSSWWENGDYEDDTDYVDRIRHGYKVFNEYTKEHGLLIIENKDNYKRIAIKYVL